MRRAWHERGKSRLDLLLWVGGAVAALSVAGYAVVWAHSRSDTPNLTPKQQAYVAAVATLQTQDYPRADATMHAEQPAPAPTAGTQPVSQPPAAPLQQKAPQQPFGLAAPPLAPIEPAALPVTAPPPTPIVTPTPVPLTQSPAPSPTPTASATPVPNATPTTPGMAPLPIPWVGVNVYGIASTSVVWGWPDPSAPTHQELLDATFGHLHAAGVDAVRFFAFQSLATNSAHKRDWSALDAVFSSAQAHGIYVIPVLGNNWPDLDSWPIGSAGTRKDQSNWYASGYLGPYDGYLTSYRQWVHDIVARYSGNPALVAWEEINEPQAASDGAADRAMLKAFAQDIASVIRSADPLTPISLGSMGTGQPGFDGTGYADMLGVADFATAHDYGYPTDPLPISPSCPYGCIRADLRDAAEMGKPFFIGEAGDTSCDSSAKASNYAAKMRAAFDAGAVGYLLWAYNDGSPAGNCGYDFGPNGEVITIFAQF